jgi:hypothetical protein
MRWRFCVGYQIRLTQEPVAYLYPYLIEAFKTRQMTGHCYSYPATMPDQKAIPLYLPQPKLFQNNR